MHRRRLHLTTPPVVGLLLAVPWTACGQAPGPDSPVAAVHADSIRILDDLRWLADDARLGRAPLTPGGEATRDRIAATFREAGVRAFEGGYARPFDDASTGELAGVNVVGWLPGSAGDAGPFLVVTAHFDHMGTRNGTVFNGADDNASGTAALLFLARHLARNPLPVPVILAAVDTEESGLVGARAFVADPPVPAGRLGLNVNLDMLSRGGGTLWAAGAYHTPALGPVLDDVAARAPMTLRQGHDRPGVPGVDDWTRSSDHGAFHEAGIPWVYFGVEDHPDVHAPTDDFERIDPSDYLDAVRTVLLAIETLASAAPLR
ncbi:MAG: M28 family peptidase [Longimicrobiales bacterium]